MNKTISNSLIIFSFLLMVAGWVMSCNTSKVAKTSWHEDLFIRHAGDTAYTIQLDTCFIKLKPPKGTMFAVEQYPDVRCIECDSSSKEWSKGLIKHLGWEPLNTEL